ncbi:MAG: hypothetical protein HYX29_09595 [Solirubrobacterales bacterium]|nr:hypothetical protein [Solirubrobacterales bacterium]
MFRIPGPDGRTAEIHDRAVRFLAVDPDLDAGALKPVLDEGFRGWLVNYGVPATAGQARAGAY